MSKSIGIINKVRNLLNRETQINLYYVFIYPYITYCNVIWGRAPNTYLLKVHILQKRVLRTISHAGFKCHTQPLFCRYKILNIYQVNKYLCCMLMYKHKTGMLPHIYNALFIPSITLHSLLTTQDNNIIQNMRYWVEFCQTSTRQNTIAYVGPNMWNNIVVRHNLHNCLSIHVFKKEIFRVILDILS